MKLTDRVLRLFDQLVANPAGVTIEQIAEDQGCSLGKSNHIVRELRRRCGVSDTINLICEPDAADVRGRWIYRLVGKLDDAAYWLANRIGDAESRIRTIQAVTASLVAASDGRTVEGRRARVMNRALTRLIEDLDELSGASDE